MQNDLKFQLFLDKRDNGVRQPSGIVGPNNYSDYFVSVPLFRSIRLLDEYVNVSKDPFRSKIEWQNINPFFIDIGLFGLADSVTSIESLAGKYNIDINK